jgi:hypothetical protein
MNTEASNAVARELAERLAAVEVENAALLEEVERKNKTLEGFMAENEALKAELAGKQTNEHTTKDGSIPPETNFDRCTEHVAVEPFKTNLWSQQIGKLESAWAQIKSR